MKSDISLAVNAGHDSLSPIDAKYRVRANEWNAVRSKCFAPMLRQVHVTSLCVLKIILGRHDRTYVRTIAIHYLWRRRRRRSEFVYSAQLDFDSRWVAWPLGCCHPVGDKAILIGNARLASTYDVICRGIISSENEWFNGNLSRQVGR